MSDLVGNPEDRFSRVAAQLYGLIGDIEVNFLFICDDFFSLMFIIGQNEKT